VAVGERPAGLLDHHHDRGEVVGRQPHGVHTRRGAKQSSTPATEAAKNGALTNAKRWKRWNRWNRFTKNGRFTMTERWINGVRNCGLTNPLRNAGAACNATGLPRNPPWKPPIPPWKPPMPPMRAEASPGMKAKPTNAAATKATANLEKLCVIGLLPIEALRSQTVAPLASA